MARPTRQLTREVIFLWQQIANAIEGSGQLLVFARFGAGAAG